MTMPTSIAVRWMRVAACGSIPPREGRAVRLADREIAIFNLGDRFLAVDNRCPHQAGPLCDGIVTGASVVCPLHAWKINLDDGGVERPTTHCERRVDTYPVSICNDVIVVGLPEPPVAEVFITEER